MHTKFSVLKSDKGQESNSKSTFEKGDSWDLLKAKNNRLWNHQKELFVILSEKVESFTNIDGCNSIRKICNTRGCTILISLLYCFWNLSPKKNEDKTKLQKLLVIVRGYLMFWDSMMFTCLCSLRRIHVTCYVVKMNVWWLMRWWKIVKRELKHRRYKGIKVGLMQNFWAKATLFYFSLIQ